MTDIIDGGTFDIIEPELYFDITQLGQVEDFLTTPGPVGPEGRGIASIARTEGTGAPGTTDTYTITYDDDTTSTFTVANGADGTDGSANIPDSPTLTGNVTLGDSDDDVLKVRAVEIETHDRDVTLGYTGANLTTVTEKAGAATIKTTTLAYTGTRLDAVTEVAGGVTVTTTLTYDGAGVLTGTTRSVA